MFRYIIKRALYAVMNTVAVRTPSAREMDMARDMPLLRQQKQPEWQKLNRGRRSRQGQKG